MNKGIIYGITKIEEMIIMNETSEITEMNKGITGETKGL